MTENILQSELYNSTQTVAKQKKSITVIHLMTENISRQIIYSIIQKYDTFDIVGDRSRSGRPKKLN